MSAMLPPAPQIFAHNRATVEQVVAHVRQGEYCTVLGPYSSGKTAVLCAAGRRLGEGDELCCVYLSLAETDTASQGAFFTSLARMVVAQLADLAPASAAPPVAPIGESTGFRAFLDALIAALGRDLVLLLDDLERVPADLLSVLLSALRALYMEQHSDDRRAGRLGVVVAGALSLAGLTVRETSPFHGIARPVHLGDLSDADSRAILEDQLAGLTASRAVREHLLCSLRGNAHLIRLICRSFAPDGPRDGAQRLPMRTVRARIDRFLAAEALEYAPLQEALRLIEEDPDLLRAVLLLVGRPGVPRRELPLRLTPDYDLLYLTGIVRRCPDGSYQLHNELYRRFLARYFGPNRVSQLLTTAGRWDEALDYLVERVRAGDMASRVALLNVTITAIYAADDDFARAGRLITQAMSTVFGAREVQIWLLSEDELRLRLVYDGAAGAGGGAGAVAVGGDRLEAQALKELHPIRAQEGGHVRRAASLWVTEGRPLGVLSMLGDPEERQSLGRGDRARLESFLRRIARALLEVTVRHRRAATLREVSRSFSGMLSSERVRELTLDQLARAIPFDSASIQYLDRHKTALEIVDCRGFANPEQIKELRFDLHDRVYPNVEVYHSRAPRHFGDVHAACPHMADPGYELDQVRGWMGVPLVVADQVIGVVTLDSHTPDIYTLEHENIAMLIASMAAVAIQRASLYERQQQEQRLIGAAAKMTGSLQSLKQTWEHILDGAMALTHAEVGNISQVDEERAQMTDQAQRGFPASLEPTRPLGTNSVQSWVARHRRSALIVDIEREPHWHQIYLTGHEGTRAELAVPIFGGHSDEVVGIINLESPRPGAFTPEDQKLLEKLAVIAGMALNNARQYQELAKHQQQLDALYTSARTITRAGLELEPVLQAILDEAVKVTGTTFGTMQLLEGAELVFRAAWPIERKAGLIERIGAMGLDGPGITARTARTGRPQLVPDVAKDAAYVLGAPGIGCELAVPLIREGQTIGVLNVEHAQPGQLGEADKELLAGLADLAVVAIANAEQYKELEDTKDFKLASQAVAWLGLFGADWQHTINQKIVSIQGYVDGLQALLSAQALAPEEVELTRETLRQIDAVAGSIRAVPFTSQVPAGGAGGAATPIDEELPRFAQRLCHDRPDIDLRLNLACAGVHVGIPPQWLQVALEKLISNALKAMPGRGALTIATRRHLGRVQLTVRDSGGGIPEQARPYFLKQTVPRTPANASAGSGMGALIARFVAMSHGGDLRLVFTEPGVGTELLFELPIVSPADA